MTAGSKPAGLRAVLRRFFASRVTLLILRICVGLVFVYASWDKAAHPDQFAEIIQDFQILPDGWVNLAALWLAWAEALAGVFLIAGIWVRGSSLLVTGLTAAFIAALISAFARGIWLHCGCFSTELAGDARSWTSLWQEGILLAACLWLAVLAFGCAMGSKPAAVKRGT